MADTRVLLHGLQEYHKRLALHVAQMQQEYQQLEVRWYVFRDVYEGDAAEQFKPGWEHTAAGFQFYIEQAQNIKPLRSSISLRMPFCMDLRVVMR